MRVSTSMSDTSTKDAYVVGSLRKSLPTKAVISGVVVRHCSGLRAVSCSPTLTLRTKKI